MSQYCFENCMFWRLSTCLQCLIPLLMIWNQMYYQIFLFHFNVTKVPFINMFCEPPFSRFCSKARPKHYLYRELDSWAKKGSIYSSRAGVVKTIYIYVFFFFTLDYLYSRLFYEQRCYLLMLWRSRFSKLKKIHITPLTPYPPRLL